MATFSENIESIEKAVYARDVRGALAESIQQAYDRVGANITDGEVTTIAGTLYDRVITANVLNVSDASVSNNTLVFGGE